MVRPLGTLSCLRAVWQCWGPHIRLWHSHPPQNIYPHTHLPLVIAIPGLALLRTEADVAPLSVPRQGTSTKYSPQRVGLTHTMEHEDVIQIVKK